MVQELISLDVYFLAALVPRKCIQEDRIFSMIYYKYVQKTPEIESSSQ